MRNTIREQLGRELRRAREAAGFDQEAAAALADVAIDRLEALEDGAMPDLEELVLLGRLYELDMAVLHDRLLCGETARSVVAESFPVPVPGGVAPVPPASAVPTTGASR